MTVTHNQSLNTIHRADIVNENVETALEQLLSEQPMDEDEQRRSSAVRYALIETMKVIIAHVPMGIDRNYVFSMIREIRRRCNDAIASGGG
jgi:hypothetical protein